jgi:hypothetical protein
MRYFWLITFTFFFHDGTAQLVQATASLEQQYIPMVATEIENLVAQQLISPADAQQLLFFFERGGVVQNLFQLQGLLQSDLSSVVSSCTHLFAPAQNAKHQHFSSAKLVGRYELQFNSPQLTEDHQGYAWLRDTTHLGPAFALQQRLVITQNTWRFGGQLAKDAGEPIWHKSPSKGLEFMSGYAAWDNPQKKALLQKLVVGAYQVQWAQGLQLWSSRGMGKSIDLLQLAKNPLGIKPYQGRDEQRYLQGISGSIKLVNHDLFCLASFKRIDSRPLQDTLQEEINFSYSSGLHRTPSEIAKRKQGQEQLYGIGVRRKTNLWQYGALLLFQHLQGSSISDSLPTQNLPIALSFWSVGAYAQGTWRQFYFYGEIAAALDAKLNIQKSSAANLAFIYHLDLHLEMGIHLRNYGPYYQAFYANPIGNSTNGVNERGCIFQLKWQVQKSLVIKVSSEYLQIPHLLNGQQFPRQSNETRVLFQFHVSKKRIYSGQVACRNTQLLPAQLRSSLTAQLHISESETVSAAAQLSTVIATQISSQHLEFSWQHAPMASKLRFEVIYGLYQVPQNAPLLYSYPYLLGFGSQTMILNGIGSYLNGSLRFAFESDWQLGLMIGLKQVVAPAHGQKIQGAVRLLKQF